MVWILHKNGMDSDLYVNGKKLSENTSRPIFIYDTTGTTFNGVSGDTNTSQSDAIDLSSKFDVAAAGLLGNSNRTIIDN